MLIGACNPIVCPIPVFRFYVMEFKKGRIFDNGMIGVRHLQARFSPFSEAAFELSVGVHTQTQGAALSCQQLWPV